MPCLLNSTSMHVHTRSPDSLGLTSARSQCTWLSLWSPLSFCYFGNTQSRLLGQSFNCDCTKLAHMGAVMCRFMGIAEQMGRVLQRTSISVNIKERLDFSCALFGPDGKPSLSQQVMPHTKHGYRHPYP